uniref:Uncharacterized protein n=1 Tax=Glossina brevipalpis TaxID=37001 RepID=A0A1A9W3Z4_9MUSC
NQTTVKIETIPDSFFDDILVDQAKERVEDAFNEELEMKYSRELEQLQELTRLQDSEKNTKLRKEKKHEKHKKSKKRSRKRSHSSEKETSTSQTNDSISHKICPTLLANPSTYGKLYETNSLRSATPSCSLTPSTNFQVINDDQSSDDNSVSNFMAFKRFKLEKPTVAEETEENFQNLTPQERAFLRVTEALESFKKYSQNQVGGEFIFTSTVRKLPNSTFGNGKFYEHRSPLHSVNNVSFKFNSHAKSFDMHEWGLEALPPKITHICRVLGYDADSLFNKLKTVKLPPKLSKLKADAHKNAEINMIDNGPSFLNNVSTQTDDDNVIELKNGPEVQSCDAAIQVIPPTANKAAQTSQENLDDLPITSIMRRFNENQLMALHDFAELLSEPYSSDAMNIYRIRQRMVDIYKGAQVQAVSSAAEIEPPPPPPMRNYRGGGGNCPNLTPVIENVYRADGSYYATNNRRPIMQKPGGYKYSPHIPPADPRRVRNSASSSTFATKSFGRGRTGR